MTSIDTQSIDEVNSNHSLCVYLASSIESNQKEKRTINSIANANNKRNG